MKRKKTVQRSSPSADSGPSTCSVEDTEGQPLPALTYGAHSGGEELLSRLEWITEVDLDIIIDYDEIKEPGVEGYSAGGRIVIRTSLPATAKAGVIAHELALCRYRHNAHELIHKKGEAARCRQQKPTTARARSGSDCVRRHAPLRDRAHPCNYLATYKVDSTQLKQSLQTISATAKFLIAAIDPQFNETGEAADDAAADPPA